MLAIVLRNCSSFWIKLEDPLMTGCGDPIVGAEPGCRTGEFNSPRPGRMLFVVGVPAFCAFNRALPSPLACPPNGKFSNPFLIVFLVLVWEAP